MRQTYAAGERLFVDYAGDTVPVVVDRLTGEVREAQVFVAVLGASSFTFACASRTQALPDWLDAHVRTFSAIGGAPELLVPDNTKTAVIKACFYDPDVNRSRGVEDVLIAVVDGLKGFPEAITAVFPQAQVQTCIVHLIRNSLDFVSYKDRRAVASALKQIYRVKDAAAGEQELDAFAGGRWGRKYPAIAQSWRRHWSEVIPFYAFPDDVRRIIYTTNAIESLNAKLRRTVRARGHFPTDESAMKLLYLVLNLAQKEWKMPPRE